MQIEVCRVIVKRNKLLFHLKYPPGLRRYFRKDEFFFEYAESLDLSRIDESILNIPVLAAVMPVAWALGIDVAVNTLDKSFSDSLSRLARQYKTLYPNFNGCSRVLTNKTVSNQFSGRRTGLLFSGGVDSMASYLRNQKLRPDLISVWGADIPLQNKGYWQKAQAGFRSFAALDGVDVITVKTNAREINEQLLRLEFGVSWWPRVSIGLVLAGICAPITADKQIGSILIASSFSCDINVPFAMCRSILESIAWADVKIREDASEMNRQEKIDLIVKQPPEYLKNLRVCYSSALNYNCGLCEKCSRTITGLTLAGENAAQSAGFKANHRTFQRIRRNLIQGSYDLGVYDKWMWCDIQKHIPDRINREQPARDFLEWLRGFDFARYRVNKPLCVLMTLYIFWRNTNIRWPAASAGRYLRFILIRRFSKKPLHQRSPQRL